MSLLPQTAERVESLPPTPEDQRIWNRFESRCRIQINGAWVTRLRTHTEAVLFRAYYTALDRLDAEQMHIWTHTCPRVTGMRTGCKTCRRAAQRFARLKPFS